MAACRRLLRSQSLAGTPSRISNSFVAKTLRSTSTSTTLPSHHNDHERNHEYRQPNRLVNSWKPAKDPKESQARLAQLRREYAKQVKELRKEYSHEMQLQMMEKQRKDEAKREALRIAREERKASKAAAAEARAAERKVSEEEFRQTLVCEFFLLMCWELRGINNVNRNCILLSAVLSLKD